jgi:DNA-binding IclR family transcriptional regulator
MGNKATLPPYHITSVDHVLQLLLLLKSRPSIRVAEAADELSVARSTAHRLLAMLVYRGFVTQDKATRAYLPGPALIEVGMGALTGLDIRRKARPFLDQLVVETGETASLQILQGSDVRFVDSVESTNAVRVASRAGVTLPAHASSGGKMLLAALSEEALLRLYPHEKLPQVTKETNTSRKVLLAELEKARNQGYSVNHGESEPGLVAVGVPLPDRSGGNLLGALTVAGPTARMDDAGIERCVAALRAAATELSRSIYE